MQRLGAPPKFRNRPIVSKQTDPDAGKRLRKAHRAGKSLGVRAAALISLLILVGSVVPAKAHAGIIADFFMRFLPSARAAEVDVAKPFTLQSLPLPRAAYNLDPNPSKGGGDITIVDDSALLPEEGPAGTIADIVVKPKNSTISVYVVRPGDTLSGIAELFGVSSNTVRWANDIPKNGTLQIGQTLTILPVTGIEYTVKSGDTLASIAKKYGGDAAEIASFNGLDAASLTSGATIVIPNGELAAAPAPKPSPSYSSAASAANEAAREREAAPVRGQAAAQYSGYYIAPLSHYVKTQGVHGYNGVDLAASAGSPVMAAASGEVIVARNAGWNGGYGNYVVIRHDNGTQTLYAHASQVIVGVGQHVVQGQVIAYEGETGRATGPHVHFEIRGGPVNPF